MGCELGTEASWVKGEAEAVQGEQVVLQASSVAEEMELTEGKNKRNVGSPNKGLKSKRHLPSHRKEPAACDQGTRTPGVHCNRPHLSVVQVI